MSSTKATRSFVEAGRAAEVGDAAPGDGFPEDPVEHAAKAMAALKMAAAAFIVLILPSIVHNYFGGIAEP